MLETYTTVDYHTAGEPFRIVESLPFDVPGEDVPARRVAAIGSTRVQRVRQLLCYEPRGHADMYGGFIVPPNDPGAAFGVLFWHKDGFSTACGHGTIALGAWAVETRRVAVAPGGSVDVVIDVPSGRVTARVHTDADGAVSHVDFINVASYLVARDVEVETRRGTVRVDIAYGGALYAHLAAADVGLEVTPEHYRDIIAIGREVKWLLNDKPVAQHPADPRLSGIYGTIVYDELPSRDGRLVQRNATVFADGEVDRSPCGSGTASRLAALVARGQLAPGQELLHESIVGQQFVGAVAGEVTDAASGEDARGIIPRVTGMAYRTGTSTFTVDPRDTLVPGFVLR